MQHPSAGSPCHPLLPCNRKSPKEGLTGRGGGLANLAQMCQPWARAARHSLSQPVLEVSLPHPCVTDSTHLPPATCQGHTWGSRASFLRQSVLTGCLLPSSSPSLYPYTRLTLPRKSTAPPKVVHCGIVPILGVSECQHSLQPLTAPWEEHPGTRSPDPQTSTQKNILCKGKE